MIKQLGLLVFLGILYILVLVSDEGARSFANHNNLARLIGYYGLLTLGAGVLIISGGIDLSMGSVVGLSATLFAVLLVDFNVPPEAAIAIVLLTGAAIGLVNGVLVTYLNLQPFIVTLCGLFIYRGLARWIAGGQNRGLGTGFQEQKALLYEGGFELPLPLPAAIVFGLVLLVVAYLSATRGWAALFRLRSGSAGERLSLRQHLAAQHPLVNYAFLAAALAWIIGALLLLPDLRLPFPKFTIIFLVACAAITVYLHLSVYGRYLFAIGSNVQAALYAGIPVRRHKIAAYVLCSFLSSFAGVLYLLQQNLAEPSGTGSYFELYAIAGAVLGGCSLRGGEGNVLGMMIGTAIIWLLPNLTIMWGIGNELRPFVIGVALLLGALIDELLRRGGAKRR